jgi:endonuclease YncB( thermonuclease family)
MNCVCNNKKHGGETAKIDQHFLLTLAFPFFWIQYQTVGEIPDKAFKRHDVIYGRVEKMIDGDTFRVRYVIVARVVVR